MVKQKAKNRIKILTILLAIVFTAQSCNFFGGGAGRAGRVELVWWKPFDDPRIVSPLIEEFQRAHPNVTVTYVQKSIETYEDELINALAAGRGPDIYAIHNDWLPKHKDKLAAAPSDVFSLRQFQEDFVETAAFDLVDEGQVYAVPLAVDVLALYYNKDILASRGIARPPSTWEELVSMTPGLTVPSAGGSFQRSAIAMGTADNVNRATDILALLMLQNGTEFYSAGRLSSSIALTARTPEGGAVNLGARALEFYTQFANPAKLTYTWNARSNNSVEAFSAGQTAMMLSYSYMRPALAQRAPFLNYAVAPVPQINPQLARINFPNYWAEGVSRQSASVAPAWEFLKFISSKEILPKYYEVQKQPSSRVDILAAQIKDPEIGVFAENALSAKSFYRPESDDMESIFAQMIRDVTLQSVSPQEAVSAAAQKINLLLRNF